MKETTDVLGHLRDKFDKLNKERDSLIDATSERKSGACCLIF